MSERSATPAKAERRGPAAAIARAIVFLRFPIVALWIAAAVLASTSLPSLFEADTGVLGNLLPRTSPPLAVESQALQRFGLPLLSHTLVVATDRRGLTARQDLAAGRYIYRYDRLPERTTLPRAVPLLNVPGVSASHPATTLVVFIYSDPSLSEHSREETTRRFASGLQHVTGVPSVEITGTVPAADAQANIAYEWLSVIEIVTVALVVGILALYFRAVGIPLLGLAAVAVAYLTVSHCLGWLGLHYGISIPQEINPIIVALLFGTLTDYVVFFVSGYRRRLAEGGESRPAITETTAELLPVILTAGLMIAGANVTLLLSGVRFLSAFGPGLAISVLIGALVAVTFVPAVLAILGPALLWPRRPDAAKRPPTEERSARGWLVGAAAGHPILITLLCLAILGPAAAGVRNIALGNPVIRGLPSDSSPHRGYDEAASAFGPGIVGPTMLVVEASGIGEERPQLARLQQQLDSVPGVAAVLGPADQKVQGRYGALLAPNGEAARFVVVLDADPNGARATEILAGLEAKLPALLANAGLSGVRTGIAGDTAIAAELDSTAEQAFLRIAPAAIAVLLVLLWVLLRTWIAPLYLIATSALVVAAALGLTVYVFQDLAHQHEIVFFVPIAGAILLLALGSDYNVFLISRIWNEADRRALQPAIRTAGTRAGRAITVAGMILALSFAAVALVPILAFRELAFMMAVGLLLDTVVARTFLIPALVSLFGRGRAED